MPLGWMTIAAIILCGRLGQIVGHESGAAPMFAVTTRAMIQRNRSRNRPARPWELWSPVSGELK